MNRPIADTLHILPAQGSGRAAWVRVRIGGEGLNWPESWLRDHVGADPELVLGACRAFGFIDEDEEWRLWDYELQVSGIGSVDVAFVSSEGRVALVEVKLARNPENRRKVVAQLLDYAIHLREASVADLKPLPIEGGVAFADPEDVQRHLMEGDFLLVVAADAADDRAAKLTRAVLDRNAIHPWDLVLVDLALFAPAESPATAHELICVPHVIGGVRCESRHVVEVKITNTAERASVVVQLAEPEVVAGGERSWDRGSFRGEFAKRAFSPGFRNAVFAWMADAEQTTGITIRYGKGKYPSVLITASGGVFATADRESIWIYGPESLKRAFGESLGTHRWGEVRALFPERAERKYFQVRATDTRIAQAIELVRRWTQG